MPPPAALRFAALALSFAFAAIAMSLGINAAVKSQDLKNFVNAHAPSGVTVDIDTHDVNAAGIVLTVAAALLALSSLLTLLLPRAPTRARAAGAPGAGALHLALATWLGATLVAFDVLARTRSARVSARLGALALPPAAVAQQERALGVSPVYWAQRYIRLLAVLPWLAVLCGAAAGAVLLREARTAAGSVHVATARAGSAERADAKSETLETLDEKRPPGEV